MNEQLRTVPMPLKGRLVLAAFIAAFVSVLVFGYLENMAKRVFREWVTRLSQRRAR